MPKEGSEFVMPASVAIVAVGTTANRLIQSTTPDLQTNRKGYISVNEETLATLKKGVLAGGDIVTGGATVILARGAGRKAAKGVHESLTSLA
jgi:glutamate synthase (NADPH/NADH) small chain